MKRAIVVLSLAFVAHVGAQQPAAPPASSEVDSAATCPVTEGFGVSASFTGLASRDSSGGDSSRTVAPRTTSRLSLDTTYVFDVAERTWSRPRLEASVAAGAVGTRPSGASWHACAGARVSMDQPTLVIRQARGTVRLHVSLDPLADAGRTTRDGQPRR